ncbi:hypothetical protein Hydth_1632 [Hydrogenobacter thermophilus TK-6]|uniref:Uncharacterized protein n=1 Tax=Hydrogenobacter thermophilus (strain DSM 6534 / IAM 12695 / TK-6) TaxID=608538 RepID=D3DJU1_HYDTT|nr:hypothetical protein [Hydrogenobacter thermophilus]ADO46015.1 hypothetical protein Hydth_1632 [Hydrogenobacter thermophilus TK-6]BAI70093.1 hypothetical protein HTH_1646 [Hydrogenobacter thermophilus TK-6]
MIKINLAKEKDERRLLERELKPTVGLPKIPSIGISKERGIYYLGALLWLCLILIAVYYSRLSSEANQLKKEIDQLNAQKTVLQTKAKKFVEEKKAIETSIAQLENRIKDIEKSKDILLGLKSYYAPFNQTFFSYVKQAPSVSWISSYRENLDINSSVIKVEMELQSLDYSGISYYSKQLSSLSKVVSVSSIERKVNQYGFEYYSAKLSAEKTLYGGGKYGSSQ